MGIVRSVRSIVLVLILAFITGTSLAHELPLREPPFWGTIWISPDIITPADPSAFEAIASSGRGLRTMFDRRVDGWIRANAYLFDATFDDGLTIEIQVNPEFDFEMAWEAAQKYGEAIGRLPTGLRIGVETVWIHKGIEPFGGGNNNILIHVGQATIYENDGILEEVLIHEAAHSSLDAAHANAPGWHGAQAADGGFISGYAQEHPRREDIAESLGPWMAVRYRADRMPPALIQTIEAVIPHRLEYFDELGLDLHPFGAAD